MNVPYYTAIGVVVLWLAYVVYAFHKTVQSDGSWYNHLKMMDEYDYNYWSRLKVTVSERMSVWRTIIIVSSITVALYIFTYIFASGLMVVL